MSAYFVQSLGIQSRVIVASIMKVMSLSEDVSNFMLMQKATIGVLERFLLKSEANMKIRVAKKIMKYKSIVDEYNNGDGSVCDGMKESYWLKRMFDHINGVYDETFDPPSHIPFRDHRIAKAISLTK